MQDLRFVSLRRAAGGVRWLPAAVSAIGVDVAFGAGLACCERAVGCVRGTGPARAINTNEVICGRPWLGSHWN